MTAEGLPTLSSDEKAQLLHCAETIKGDWIEFRLLYRAVYIVNELEFAVRMADGEDVDFFGDVRSMMKLLGGVRRNFYRSGRGTWFSVEVVVCRTGEVRACYNYDDEPTYDLSVPVEYFAQDLEVFPRDEAFIPDWLRSKLAT